jgi:hypothetical protein
VRVPSPPFWPDRHVKRDPYVYPNHDHDHDDGDDNYDYISNLGFGVLSPSWPEAKNDKKAKSG